MVGTGDVSVVDASTSGASRNRHWQAVATILVAPIGWAIAGLVVTVSGAPMWQTMADPVYVYLVGGVEIVQGQPSFANQHPGTPLFWLYGLVSVATHMVSGGGVSLAQDVVARPETFLTVVDVTLVLVQSAGLFAIGWGLWRRFGIGAALVAQAIGMTARTLLDSPASPVPLQLAVMLALIGVVASALDGRRALLSGRRAAAIGVLLAVGVTAKLTFWPALVLPLLLYRRRDLLRIYLWFAGFSVVTVLLTVRGELLNSVVWWRNLLLTSGRTPGDTATRSITSGLLDLPSIAWTWTPLIVVALLAVGGCVVVRWRRSTAPDWLPWRGFGALGLVVALSYLATVKTWRPWDLVLIPVALAAIVAIAWAWLVPPGQRTRATRWLAAVPVLAVVLSLTASFAAIPADVNRTRAGKDYLDLVAYIENRVASGETVMTSYGVFDQATALYFGQWLSHRTLAPEIVARYPGYLEYKLENAHFYYFTSVGEVEFTCSQLRALAESARGLIYVPGRTVDFPTDQPQYESITMEPVRTFGSQTVYRITGVECGDRA